jgi:hypothetical protein
MDFLHYSTLAIADTYFANALHDTDWAGAPTASKIKALWDATLDVDALNYAGVKRPVYVLLQDNPDASAAEISTAAATQEREFPRDDSDDVPEAVEIAVFEIARARLRGKDPEQELENLWLTSDGSGSTRASYDRTNGPPRHLANGIVSWIAWRWLQPLLANVSSFDVRRV